MPQSPDQNPPPGQPVVKRIVGNKPKKKKWLDLKSPKEIFLTAILIIMALSVGNYLLDFLKIEFGLTDEAIAQREAMEEYRASIKEIEEKEARSKSEDTAKPADTTSVATRSQGSQREWYQGGTLHSAGALEWQQATYANKLATCGDFVSNLWKTNKLAPTLHARIESMDHIRVLAELLVEELDKAMEPLPDAEENRKAYANQTVNELAVYTVILLNWTR